MSGAIGSIGKQSVDAVGAAGSAPAQAAPAASTVLPAPDMEIGAAKADVMALLYALTTKQRDTATSQRASAAERKGVERQQAFDQMREEIQKAKDAKEDGSWLGKVTEVLDSAADAAVGGNPLQDLAHKLSESTDIGAFEIAYDFIRPDALMHGAVLLGSLASDEPKIAQAYDVGAGSSSLKTRFQGAADMTGRPEVMDAYAVTRDTIAMAMVSVGTCGTGTVAMVAVASSAALMIEAKADLLGKLGVADKEKMWLRIGAQAVVLVGTIGASYATAANLSKGAIAARVATNVVNGSNQVARGSVQVGEAIYEYRASEHLTESAKHQNTQHQADREQQRLIGGLREVSKSYQRSLETIASTMNERDQIPLMLARNIA